MSSENPITPSEIPSKIDSKAPRGPHRTCFDQIWVENRKRKRKGLTGSQMSLDVTSGYLESPKRTGFRVEDKKAFIVRLQICKNISQIARSLDLDVQSLYDAIAIDTKFREDVNEAFKIPNRSMQLNNALIQAQSTEKTAVIANLLQKAAKYKQND